MKVRLRYSKIGKVRWISHRDTARVWERALRRAGLPVAYTEGFSPRPKVSFGLALSTGYESLAEYLDVSLRPDDPIDLSLLPERLTAALPTGLECQAVALPDPSADSLQQAVTSCSWELRVTGLEPDAVHDRAAGLIAATEIPYQRVRKGNEVTDDLRPALLDLRPHCVDGDVVVLSSEIATQPRAVKPQEVIAALGSDLYEVPGRRTHQWIERPDGRAEPIGLAASPGDAHAEVRAS